jgi:uncharacterized lipoprotein YmbA
MSIARSMRRLVTAFALLSAAALLAASCASPPLTLYTLGVPSAASDAAPLGNRTLVIEVRRVTVPDYLDSEDILVRDGNILVRSSQGRWATRVSLGVTYFVTGKLAQRRPDALVTSESPPESPAYRLSIDVSTLDVTSGGTATLDADWQFVPRDAALPTKRGRGRFTSTGPVATDQDVVTLTVAVLQQLADAIDVTGLR